MNLVCLRHSKQSRKLRTLSLASKPHTQMTWNSAHGWASKLRSRAILLTTRAGSGSSRSSKNTGGLIDTEPYHYFKLFKAELIISNTDWLWKVPLLQEFLPQGWFFTFGNNQLRLVLLAFHCSFLIVLNSYACVLGHSVLFYSLQPTHCSPPGSSFRGIFQATIPE